MKTANPKIMAYIVIFLIPMSGLAIDIYTPALPIIQHALNVSSTMAKYTISAYILGFGIAQLLWGALSDQYGRKRVLLIGLYLFLFSSLLLPLTTHIGIFILLRVIQGVAVGAVNTSARTVIIDLFTGAEFKKYINSCTIAWSLSPIVAPAIGAALIDWINWTACFYALSLYALLALILVHVFLVRTNKDIIVFNIRTMSKNITRVIKDRDYCASLSLVILGYSSLTVFYVMGPFIIQTRLHHSPLFFGRCAGIIGCAWLAGNLLIKLFSIKKWSLQIKKVIGIMVFLCVLAYALYPHLPLLQSYMGFLISYITVAACIFPTMFAYCLNKSRDIAGTVSAVTGAGFWFFGGIASMLASHVNIHVTLNIFHVYSCLTLLMLITYLFYVPKDSAIRSE